MVVCSHNWMRSLRLTSVAVLRTRYAAHNNVKPLDKSSLAVSVAPSLRSRKALEGAAYNDIGD